jgi:hypothetical protein
MSQGDDTRHASEPGREGAAVGRRVLATCLAVLGMTTAVIHFAVAGSHFQEYWAFGVFMLAAAWLQVAWAIGVVARPSRALAWCGIALNTGVVAVYVVTRTVGDVVGPTPHQAEPVGFGDLLCTTLEALIALGCVGLLASGRQWHVLRDRRVLAPSVTGALAAVLLSVSLVAGGPEMVMASAGPDSVAGPMQMTGTAASISLPTSSPAGKITMPDPTVRMAAGMQMADTTPCTATPTAAQQQAAVSLVDDSWAAARKYQSLDAAKAAGYRPITPTGKPVVHYLNPAYYRDTAEGGPVLDTAQPQSLVYANTPKGAVLAAAMYIAAPGQATPQPGGCLTQWHLHTNLCLQSARGVVGTTDSGCPAGSSNHDTPPMLHVWFVPIPGGPTAVDAPDKQVVHAAEQVPTPPNGTA